MRWLTLAVAMLLAGCQEGVTESAIYPPLRGVWTEQSSQGTVRLYLEVSETSVSGLFQLSPPGGMAMQNGNVTGQYNVPRVSLEIVFVGDPMTMGASCTLEGEVAESGERITGTVTCNSPMVGGSGSFPVSLQRAEMMMG